MDQLGPRNFTIAVAIRVMQQQQGITSRERFHAASLQQLLSPKLSVTIFIRFIH